MSRDWRHASSKPDFWRPISWDGREKKGVIWIEPLTLLRIIDSIFDELGNGGFGVEEPRNTEKEWI